MSERVVVQFEVVDINHQERRTARHARAVRQHLCQPNVETAAIRNTGERIGERLVAKLIRRLRKLFVDVRRLQDQRGEDRARSDEDVRARKIPAQTERCSAGQREHDVGEDAQTRDAQPHFERRTEPAVRVEERDRRDRQRDDDHRESPRECRPVAVLEEGRQAVDPNRRGHENGEERDHRDPHQAFDLREAGPFAAAEEASRGEIRDRREREEQMPFEPQPRRGLRVGRNPTRDLRPQSAIERQIWRHEARGRSVGAGEHEQRDGSAHPRLRPQQHRREHNGHDRDREHDRQDGIGNPERPAHRRNNRQRERDDACSADERAAPILGPRDRFAEIDHIVPCCIGNSSRETSGKRVRRIDQRAPST